MSRKVILGLGPVLSGVFFAALPVAHAQVFIETVRVGNPGNAGENSGESEPGGMGPDRICGAVDYVYEIGKFELTAGEYTTFLNAVAATDTYALYNEERMWRPDSYGCRIVRTGSSGDHSYSVADDWADRPVNYVSWGDAARFCNWLHNGQPTGIQDLSTTEDGSYFLNGATSRDDLMTVTRKVDATWVIPSEDEWYKAAFHKNDGVTGNYFDYATSSDTEPDSECCSSGENSSNYDYNGYEPGGAACGYPYYTNIVGCHVLSGSPYGTFDQGGNIIERNEFRYLPYNNRGIRDGAYAHHASEQLAAFRGYGTSPSGEYTLVGFRVAKVADPVCGVLDTDDDIDIDLADFAAFQNDFSGHDLADYTLLHDCLDGPAQ